VVAGVEASIHQASANQRSPAAGSQATTPQPASSGHPHGEVATDDAQIEAARQLVQFPAMGLTVIGILLLVLGIFAGLLTSTWALRQTAPIALFLFLVLPIVALTMLSTWIIVGGLKMLRLTSYGWAVGASVLAVSPIPAGPLWLLSLPLGIWSLVVLSKPEVKRGFSRSAKASNPPELDVARMVQNPAWGLIITGVISWVTIPLAFWIPIVRDLDAAQRTIFQISFGVVPLIVGTTWLSPVFA
jgi:hypothetical protein